MFSRRDSRTLRRARRIDRPPLHVEFLESRQLLATLVSPTTVSYQDLDGDQVQARLSQPLLTAANVNDVFHFSTGGVNGGNAARQALDTIDLAPLGASPGLSLAVEVTRRSRLGDGAAGVGLIDAAGKSLGRVRIDGDLGAIVTGNYDLTTRSITTVVHEILGRYDDNRDGQVNINTNDLDDAEITTEAENDTFSKMDSDFSFRISRPEIAAYLSRHVDTNLNGQISGLEIQALVGRSPDDAGIVLTRRGIDVLSVRSLGDTTKLPRSITAAVDEVFRRYDVNADGQIQFADPAEVPQDAQHVNTFSQMDANSDSRISRPELAAYFSRAVDTNSNNTLSTIELDGYEAGDPISSGHLFGRSFQFPRRLDTAVSAILHRYDANGDGLINLDQTSEGNEVASPDALNIFSSMDGDFDALVGADDIQSWVSGNADLEQNGHLSAAELDTLRQQDVNAFNALFASFPSHVFGDLGTFAVSRHLIGTQFRIDGTLQNAAIGGSVLNSSAAQGEIAPTFNLQRITVGGNLEGRIVADRDLAYAQVNGSMPGGSDDNSANLGAGRDLAFARVVGEVVGGTGFASGVLFANRHTGTVIVGGSLRGGAGDFSGTVLAVGNIRYVGIGRDLVGGATEAAPFAFGFTHHTGLVRGRRIGEVTVGRDVLAATNGLTGIQAAETLGVVVIGRDSVGQPNNPVVISAGGEPLTLARAAEDVFAGYDWNRDGFINIGQGIARREVTSGEQINTFSNADGDFDGRVTRSDLRDWISANVDLDKDGILTASELGALQLQNPAAFNSLFGSGGPSTPLAEIAAQILRRYDANRDDRIDLRQNIARREVTTDQELNTFSAMDGDFDTRVTPAELRAYLDSTVDVDRDGFLIPAEANAFQGQDPTAFNVLFTAPGIELTPSSGLADVAIGAVVVGRDLVRTEIRAGYDVELSPIDGDAQIRTILVGRDWIGSSAIAGVIVASGPAPAFVADESPPADPPREIIYNLPGIVSRIDRVIVGRRVLDDPAEAAILSAIAAQHVRKTLVGGRRVPQEAGSHNDDLPLTFGGKSRIREAPRRAIAAAP